MKLLFENWRQYLIKERYSIKDAFTALRSDNKKMRNLYKRYNNSAWYDEVESGLIDPREEPEPNVPEEHIAKSAASYREYILEVIPEDIWGPGATTDQQRLKEADKNQGLAIMWLRKLSLKDPELAKDIIEGEISFVGGGRPYANIMPDLEIYFQNLDLMPKKNLIELESIEELHQMVEAAKEEIHARQEEKQYLDADEGTEVLRDDGEWYIAAIHNKGAACELGKGTDWCTAAPGLDYFSEYYAPDDPLFFFKASVPGYQYTEKYQFHYGSEQFMDAEDRPVDEETFKELSNLLMQTEAPQKYPVVQIAHWKEAVGDHTTTPEELAEIAENPEVTEEILWEIAKNPNTPLKTLRALSNSVNKYLIRSLQVNPQLGYDSSGPDPTEEGMKLAKEIFLNHLRDTLIFDRGLKQIGRWIKAGIMSKEEAQKALEDHLEAEEFRKKARKVVRSDGGSQAMLRERKIRIRRI